MFIERSENAEAKLKINIPLQLVFDRVRHALAAADCCLARLMPEKIFEKRRRMRSHSPQTKERGGNHFSAYDTVSTRQAAARAKRLFNLSVRAFLSAGIVPRDATKLSFAG